MLCIYFYVDILLMLFNIYELLFFCLNSIELYIFLYCFLLKLLKMLCRVLFYRIVMMIWDIYRKINKR